YDLFDSCHVGLLAYSTARRVPCVGSSQGRLCTLFVRSAAGAERPKGRYIVYPLGQVSPLLKSATAPFMQLRQSIQAGAPSVRFGFLVVGGQ
ncbi:MAG TPA: hypothetical protein VMV21_03045, partial [Vicinamibacteria bacterium]|nr:hypothetical protein [Vicinamibacteria bacterium]